MRRRFIPACAGNIPGGIALGRPTPVHPRVCGEHLSSDACNSRQPGSSPRVRGTFATPTYSFFCNRFIPACAGNIGFVPIESCVPPVHPRVCGEHLAFDTHRRGLFGSSPRVRGTFLYRPAHELDQRFIPACAGNICHAQNFFPLATVHPRVCGEHDRDLAASLYQYGSSPRVRGTCFLEAMMTSSGRFIPACAGNIWLRSCCRWLFAVHPRVCGEHRGIDGNENGIRGSSPRVRGTSPSGQGTARPRGSSPRVRGTFRVLCFPFSVRRFIPACAGNIS